MSHPIASRSAETELAASLEHPNVVPIHDAGEVEGQLYLVMRYVEGGELKTLLGREGALEPARALAVCAQVGAGLDAAHGRGLVHRDVKPSNVLLDEGEHVYLADFGLSRRLADPRAAGDDRLSGTPAYVSPEQIQGADVDGRADVYALGCLAYECLTGQPPFPRASDLAVLFAHMEEPPPKPSESNPALATGIDAVVATAMAKSPDDRYVSCAEFIEASSDALGLHPPVGKRDRRGLILSTIGIAIIAAAVVTGVLLSQGSDRPGKPSTKPTLTPKVDSLQHIDPKTNKLVATVGGVGSNPSAIATGAGSVWVGSQDDGTVSRVDPRTDAVRSEVVKTGGPDAIAIRDGEMLIASQDGTVTSVDPATLRVTSTANAWYGAFALDQGVLWALGAGGGGLSRINRSGDVVTTLYNIGWDPFALAFGEGSVWVVDDVFRTLYRVDTVTNRVVGQTALGFDPSGITVGGGSVWVADASSDAVARIDPRRNRVAGLTRVGRDPVGLAFGSGAVWVTNYEDGSISRIDPRTGAVVATVSVGRDPAVIATGAGGVWVAVRGPD